MIPETYTTWDNFDGTESIDSTSHKIDSTNNVDSSNEISVLLSLMLGVDVQNLTIDKFRIYKNKLLCAGVLENQMMV
jgi:hypothetical protein